MRALTRACTAVLVVAVVVLASSSAQAQFTYYRDDHVRYRPAHVGLSAVGGAQFHTHDGSADGFLRAGLDVIGTLVPGFALGFTRLGFTGGYDSIEGVLFGIGLTPTIELSFFAGTDVQLFLQLGSTVHVQAPTNHRAGGVNAAVTTVIGVRFWLGNCFSFGIVLGNDVGATNPGLSSYFGGLLAQGEVSFFGGLELGWNL